MFPNIREILTAFLKLSYNCVIISVFHERVYVVYCGSVETHA